MKLCSCFLAWWLALAADAVFPKRDKDSGSIYIFDNSISGSGNTFKVDDNYLEQNETWFGSGSDFGSYTCVVHAAAKNNFELDESSPDSYHYLLAIKSEDVYSSGSYTDTYTSWEILPVESDGTPRWEYSSYTDSIAGYEDLFGQDLDGEDGIGMDLGDLTAITSDETDDGVQLFLADSGAIFISDASKYSGGNFCLDKTLER